MKSVLRTLAWHLVLCAYTWKLALLSVDQEPGILADYLAVLGFGVVAFTHAVRKKPQSGTNQS
ncbi:hypothetical protein [Roseibacillus ishigakijimensis]|uniref:Uncharacterized protein n=1 Tax=Roseibacillus ishigakijimensis TaxID=454146 RepID=A0A934RQL9_9BACT|nr:hypothetical protein [Roseibacillus ishigakijimensis]MBK1833801.1 hypothetical protein [Roseibacillus ishigakijimensis]